VGIRIVGRSSSHFTRIARLFAHELGVPHEFEPVLDLTSRTASDYAGNPSLRLPVLVTETGPWFGALNVARELARRAPNAGGIVWPEDLVDRLSANAQEIVLQSMAAEVVLVMRSMAEPAASGAYDDKLRVGLLNGVAWLEEHFLDALDALPRPRAHSFLEVSAFCFLAHLDFRQVLDTHANPRLRSFCAEFGERAAARATTYCYDGA
jgi:glutathione S-transferase